MTSSKRLKDPEVDVVVEVGVEEDEAEGVEEEVQEVVQLEDLSEVLAEGQEVLEEADQ